MRYKIPLRDVAAFVRSRAPFDANGTLRGHRGRPSSTGMLHNEWVLYLRQFGNRIQYTIMSYQTPVAWLMADGRWIVPPASYSQTTGRHMRAIGLPFSQPVVNTDEEAA